jgi:hypothetical protein
MIKIDLDIYWERYQLKTPNTRSPDNLIIPGSYFFNTIIIINNNINNNGTTK